MSLTTLDDPRTGNLIHRWECDGCGAVVNRLIETGDELRSVRSTLPKGWQICKDGIVLCADCTCPHRGYEPAVPADPIREQALAACRELVRLLDRPALEGGGYLALARCGQMARAALLAAHGKIAE